MIDVTTDWYWAVVYAGVGGAVGGLVYDMLLQRHGDSGLLERWSVQRPDKAGGRTFFDVGFFASLLVGIVAAVAFLYFLPPETTTTTDADGVIQDITKEYDPFKLIPAALIVGSSGAAFITAMRERLLKVIAATSLENLASTISAQQAATTAIVDAAQDSQDTNVNASEALSRLQGQLDTLNTLALNAARTDL